MTDDKNVKHEDWNYILRNLKNLDEKYILLLQFPDTGTKYRARNEVTVLVNSNI